ncbi:flagellar hook-associated protein FlgL [Afipia felis]|uniref:Flagellar hook-associated protein FlgL n=1 Tax=Afipia felis TaxID=1035 RepID=A0A090MMA5_AFIFE|nr:flagellar hook protein FlgL [Afipia felis]CEG07397.1 flagellar hook-associated protein FlgL [Afipia felis]
MTIEGVSGRTSYLGSSLLNIKTQLDTLTQQLASGKKSTTYSGLGLDSAFATGLRSQISMLSGYQNTQTNVTTRINVANLSLQGLVDMRTQVQSAATGASQVLNANGQTSGQQIGYASFTQAISLLNTQSGDRYLFSGRATDTPSTAAADDILNGADGKDGLKAVIADRLIADQGTGNMGRLTTDATTTPGVVTVGEDANPSPFGLKLSRISTSINGAVVTQPATAGPPTPSSETIDLNAATPKEGDTVIFTFTLPDQTTETVQLTATTASPAPDGSFTIDADPTVTATNMKSALDSSIQTLVKGPMVAASAMAAGQNFFDNPPQRVGGGSPVSPTATTLVDGSATTVQWYTGEQLGNPDADARNTAVAQVDGSVSVSYGATANESAFRNLLQNMAVYAAVTTTVDPNDPNGQNLANAQISALNERVNANLAVQPGTTSVEDIEAQFAGAQSATKSASTRQTQTTSMAQTMLDQIQGVNDDEVAAKILALQTSLQASYQTTASLYQLSLVKYLPVG